MPHGTRVVDFVLKRHLSLVIFPRRALGEVVAHRTWYTSCAVGLCCCYLPDAEAVSATASSCTSDQPGAYDVSSGTQQQFDHLGAHSRAGAETASLCMSPALPAMQDVQITSNAINV